MQIRVFCRVRPGPASAVVCLPDGLSVRLEGQTEGIKDSSFAFDKVFGGQSSQAEVFAEVSDMVQSALDGYKVAAAAAAAAAAAMLCCMFALLGALLMATRHLLPSLLLQCCMLALLGTLPR